MINTTCDNCGKPIRVKNAKAGYKHYCDRKCFMDSRRVEKPCFVCGKIVVRPQSQMMQVACCSDECTKKFTGMRMEFMNAELNPERMNIETRTKLRKAHLNSGEGKSYEKTFGKHTHRIVAAEKLGRDLLPGEVVHHDDENKRNNDPDNLVVFSSQSEHAAHHQKQKKSEI